MKHRLDTVLGPHWTPLAGAREQSGTGRRAEQNSRGANSLAPGRASDTEFEELTEGAKHTIWQVA